MPTEIFYTSNEQDYTRLEGVYVNEKDPPGFVRGADLSAIGVIGVTVRGPTDIQEITSMPRFAEIYGGRDYGSGGTLINKIWKDLIAKPWGKLYVKRVTDASAVAGSVSLTSTSIAVVTVSAATVGAWSLAANNGPKVTVAAATNGSTPYFNLTVSYQGDAITYEDLYASTGASNDDIAAIIGDDPSNLITVTLDTAGRPSNVSSSPLTGGSDGTPAASDFTSALTAMATADGPRIVFCADVAASQANLNAQIVTEAAAASDRIFVTWAGVHGQTVSAEASTVGSQITTRSDRILWCYNSPYYLDPTTGTQLQVSPAAQAASIMSQTDVDIHLGAPQTKAQTAAIRKLTNQSLSRGDLITLRDAGISTLEKTSLGFLFKSGVTTNLTAGLTELSRRRMADFLLLSLSARLAYFVKKKNTAANRAQIATEAISFSQKLKNQERIVRDFLVSQDVNTDASRALGIEKLLYRVDIISHILFLPLEAEIGFGTVLEV